MQRIKALELHQLDDDLKTIAAEAEIIELGVSAAMNVGLGRFNAAIGIEPV